MIQLIPGLSPLLPITGFIPIVFILGVAMIKEGLEDYARHKEDNANNSGKYSRLMPDASTTEVKSAELKPGWVVRINENQQFPSGLSC